MDEVKSSVPEERQEEHSEARACFYCLGGWVFLGGLDEDGQEEYYPVYCRRCGGSGVLQAS